MKKWLSFLFVAIVLCWAANSFAAMGYVSAKSSDVDIKLFGSEQMWPTFIHNASFNEDDKAHNWIGREDGHEQQFNIRNQFRMGWKITGDKWSGMFILEDDVNATKTNIDRAENGNNSSAAFGLEKLEFHYNFSKCFIWEMGWNGKALDVKTGGLVYTDDHPFIGFKGAGKNWKYEVLFMAIRNDGKDGLHTRPGVNNWSGVQDNLFAYTAKLYYTFDTGSGKLTVAPFFAYQDNKIARADAYYFGLELFGKLGIVVPRFEIVYVTGKQDGVMTMKNGAATGTDDLDIDAWAGFWSLEFDLNKAFKPYLGMWYISGDGDGNDGDAEDFQGITNIAKFTPTFGMGYGSSLTDTNIIAGTVLYSINPTLANLKAGLYSGYGSIGGVGTSGSPGVIFYGIGFKGNLSDIVAKGLSYKIQGFYMEYEDTGALEDWYGKSIDEEMGWGIAWNLKYQLNKHFYILNTLNIFDPGDGIEDKWGNDYDDTLITNTTEFAWKW